MSIECADVASMIQTNRLKRGVGLFAEFALTTTAFLFATSCGFAPRFLHVDTHGGAPYVFFDQKTKQVCWGAGESANGKLVSVAIAVNGNAVAYEMPVCKDL